MDWKVQVFIYLLAWHVLSLSQNKFVVFLTHILVFYKNKSDHRKLTCRKSLQCLLNWDDGREAAGCAYHVNHPFHLAFISGCWIMRKRLKSFIQIWSSTNETTFITWIRMAVKPLWNAFIVKRENIKVVTNWRKVSSKRDINEIVSSNNPKVRTYLNGEVIVDFISIDLWKMNKSSWMFTKAAKQG